MTADTVFALPVPARPTLVVFDKGNWLLKELQWDKAADEWAYQAAFAEQPVDRMRALEQLPLLPGNGVFISLVGRVARSDNSWSVRRKAVATLPLLSDSTDELLRRGKETLLAACGDPNARVRAEAVTMLRTLRGDDVVAQLHRSLKDSSYAVVASALRSLAVVDSAHAAPLLVAHLDVPSHGNAIENAALGGLALVDSAQALKVSLQKVRYGEPQWIRYTALHLLGKYGKNREDVRTVVTALAGDKNRVIQSTAIGILGTIGDEAAVPILEKIAADSTHRSSAAARESLEKIKTRTHPYHE